MNSIIDVAMKVRHLMIALMCGVIPQSGGLSGGQGFVPGPMDPIPFIRDEESILTLDIWDGLTCVHAVSLLRQHGIKCKIDVSFGMIYLVVASNQKKAGLDLLKADPLIPPLIRIDGKKQRLREGFSLSIFTLNLTKAQVMARHPLALPREVVQAIRSEKCQQLVGSQFRYDFVAYTQRYVLNEKGVQTRGFDIEIAISRINDPMDREFCVFQSYVSDKEPKFRAKYRSSIVMSPWTKLLTNK